MKKLWISLLVLLTVGCSTQKEIDNGNLNKYEELNVENSMVMKFNQTMNYMNDYFIGEDLFGYFYQKDKYTVDDVKDEVKIFLAIRSLYQPSWDNVGIDEFIEVSEDDVKKSFENLFGISVSFKNKDVGGSPCGYAGFKYDESKKIYTQIGNGCGGIGKPTYKTKIVSAKKYKDRIEFVEKVAYLTIGEDVSKGYKVYKSSDKQTELGPITDNVIEDYLESLDSYKYTFKYDSKNDKYYFYSVEKVID